MDFPFLLAVFFLLIITYIHSILNILTYLSSDIKNKQNNIIIKTKIVKDCSLWAYNNLTINLIIINNNFLITDKDNKI